MKQTLIYAYTDINAFLDQIERLQNEYNNINYYYKCIHNITDTRNQLNYLKRKNILSSSGFLTKKTIKLTISDGNKKICITYRFKHEYDYKIFNREIRKIGLKHTPLWIFY